MRRGMGPALGAALVGAALSAAAHAHAQSFIVSPELWDRPRSGPAVIEQPAIKQAVGVLLAHPRARLLVHHGADQDTYSQAEELRTWLIALAIEGSRVVLRNDLGPPGPLRLEVLHD